MIDWTQIIITCLTLLLGGGGIVTIVTLRDKKNAAMLENIAKVIESNAKTNEAWENIAHRKLEDNHGLEGKIERKDSKIDSLYGEITQLRIELDHTRTQCAVAALLKCDVVECGKRHPPLGRSEVDKSE